MADNNIDRETLVEEKKREDLKPELRLLGDEEVEVFMMADAALYLGLTRPGLDVRLKRLEKEGRPIRQYTDESGGVKRYLLKRDLDRLRRIKPVE